MHNYSMAQKEFANKRTREQKDLYDRIALMEFKINMILELLEKLELIKDGKPIERR
jgi:hypothetical protein